MFHFNFFKRSSTRFWYLSELKCIVSTVEPIPVPVSAASCASAAPSPSRRRLRAAAAAARSPRSAAAPSSSGRRWNRRPAPAGSITAEMKHIFGGKIQTDLRREVVVLVDAAVRSAAAVGGDDLAVHDPRRRREERGRAVGGYSCIFKTIPLISKYRAELPPFYSQGLHQEREEVVKNIKVSP